MLTVSDGVGILTENLFSGRFRYVEELRRMGADIRTEGHHAVVRGVARLSGAPVRAPDIRAGVALVLAGLVADGETVVSGAHHIDRGYEDLAGTLRSLGAKVSRVSPLPTDPAALLERARAGRPRRARKAALARRAGRRLGTAVAHLAYRSDLAYRSGLRAPGRGQVDADRQPHREVRGSWPEAAPPHSRAGDGPDVALQRWRHPWRPGADAATISRPARVHPLDGDTRAPGRSRPGRARCRQGSRRCGTARGPRRDRRRRAGRGRRRRRPPTRPWWCSRPLGRRRPGEQGGLSRSPTSS